MPKIAITTIPRKPPVDADADADDARDQAPTGIMNRAKDLLSGRAGERREKKRTRAPRNMMGRRG